MVKNEAKHLEECLESLSPIREELDTELIVVDTGSDDNTVDIAKKFTDNVYFHEWNDNFSEMRNTVISYAKGDWYFSLDGDEIVENPKTIINFFKSEKHKKYNTCLVTQKNNTDLKGERFSEILVPRLFKNDADFHFEGAVHNQPKFKKPLFQLNTILDHYGYISSDKKLMEKKFNRTSTILKQELKRDPKNIYYWYQLSKSYLMHDDEKEALKAIEKAYNLAKKNKVELKNRMYIYIQLAQVKMIFQKPLETKEICEEALRVRDGYIDLYYYLAWAQRNVGLEEEAIESYEKYLDIYNNYDDSVCKKDISVSDNTLSNIEGVYTNLIILYNKYEKHNKIINYSDKLANAKYLKKVGFLIVKAYYNNNQINDLIDYYCNLEEDEKSIIVLDFEKLINRKKSEELNNFINKLSELKDSYGLLNRIRSQINNKTRNNYKEELSKLKYEELPNFYGDILYFIFNQSDLYYYEILKNIREESLNRFIKYLNSNHDDLAEKIINFINNQVEGVSELRVNKSFLRYLLALDNEVEKTNKDIIDNYLNAGTKYIQKVYTKEIIRNELIFELKNEEEAFLLYILKGFAVKESELKSYIKYLRKAIDIYPPMKKVVETLISEIKEEQNKINEKIERKKNEFKRSIETLINKGRLEESKKLIVEYKNNFEMDADIYSMLGVIALNNGDINQAELNFEKGLIDDNTNIDLLYNLGYVYEQKGKYLKALESYEKMIFQMDDCAERNEMIKYINDFEENYKESIQSQLENRDESGIEYIENPKYKYVHLMYDNFYCNKFMHFTNEHFNEKEHLYLFIVPEGHNFNYVNPNGAKNAKIINLKNDINKLNYYFNNTNKIFIHYLFGHICRTLIKLGIKKELFWVLYGGDLYNHIDKELHSNKTKEFMTKIGFEFKSNKSNLNKVYRKSLIRELNFVLTSKKGDYEIFKNNFISNTTRFDFLHPLPVDFDLLDEEKIKINEKYNFENKYEKVLLVGNSANSLNNHIDILYELKRYNLKNTCIIMPLSYSGHDRYINQLIKKGKEMFGDKFIPITEYLPHDVYSNILKQVDVAIFNHNRQQALANIIALLYLGKKVYIKKNISSYNFLTSQGLKVYKINELKNSNSIKELVEIDSEISSKNRTNVKVNFNINQRNKIAEKIFNKRNEFKIIVLGNQKSGTSAIAHLLAEYGQLNKTIDIPNLLNNNKLKDGILESKYFSNTLIKEPTLTFFYEDLLKKYPIANYIFIVRHPLDNIRSILDRVNIAPDKLPLSTEYVKNSNIKDAWKDICLDSLNINEYNTLTENLVHRWRRAVKTYLENKQNFYLVKYEDFNNDKIKTIKNLGSKIGISEKADISNIINLQFQPKGSNREKNINELFSKQIINKVESICKEEMFNLEYEFYGEKNNID